MSTPGSIKRWSWRTAWMFAAGVGLSWGCRSGEGDACVCQSDCRPGLVCAQNGSPIQTECVTGDINVAPGRCIAGDTMQGGGTSLGDPPVYLDVGSKRDFEPGMTTSATADDSGSAGSGSGSDTSPGGSGSSSGGSGSSGGSSGSGSSGSSGSGG